MPLCQFALLMKNDFHLLYNTLRILLYIILKQKSLAVPLPCFCSRT